MSHYSIRVCFVGWAGPSEHPGSPPLELQAMHCGLETNTRKKLEYNILQRPKCGCMHALEKCTYRVSPTWSGTDSVLHPPSVWLQRCRRRQERAGNRPLMRSENGKPIKIKKREKVTSVCDTATNLRHTAHPLYLWLSAHLLSPMLPTCLLSY